VAGARLPEWRNPAGTKLVMSTHQDLTALLKQVGQAERGDDCRGGSDGQESIRKAVQIA